MSPIKVIHLLESIGHFNYAVLELFLYAKGCHKVSAVFYKVSKL